ncbi:MAG: hypothetical protein O7J95_02000 [Planctomycetota bacterium]|nr:hypothetical protein [Planctomycetota bacterium]
MLHFYKFCEEVPAPVPARETYQRREPGKGWPEECPPLRAASAFGWDVVACFDMRFRQKSGEWRLENPRDIESDWLYQPVVDEASEESEESEGTPMVQRNAWFWEEKQGLPHPISPGVYGKIKNQVKVSTYLFMSTDQNELLYLCDVPTGGERPFRAISALLDTDWYPASYPWHCVLELDARREEITIEKGEPLCRLFLVRRESYFAREMSTPEFEGFFQRGQEWLRRHGRGDSPEMLDITRTYVKQQSLSRFSVIV